MEQALSRHRTAFRARPLTLTALCLAVLVAQVDTAVVNLALHPIGEALSAGVDALQWVVDGYNLVYAALLLTGGLLADLHGRRRVFMAGAAIFTLASIACAMAPSVGLLIAGRVAAGVGAALLVPASLAIIRVAWPEPGARGRALGIWAACNGLALAIGPTLGGLLIRRFGWPAVFLAVVPLGLLALALAPMVIAESADPGDRRFDPAAQALGGLGLGGFAFAAIEMEGAPAIAALSFAAGVLALALFIHIERRAGQAALVPLDLFGIARFRGAVVATTGMTFGMYGVLFLLPLAWQGAGGLDAAGAGLALMPMALVFLAASPFSGTGARRLGVPAMTGGGVGVIACGLLTVAAAAGAASIVPAELGLALTGLGMGMATGPLMGEAVGAVAAARSGTASALINVARMVGATIGVAILGALFALAGGGVSGLRAAMIAGGAVQLACAMVAWRTMGRREPAAGDQR
jgi:EmrB/QacA subfamily drug resistance transporter